MPAYERLSLVPTVNEGEVLRTAARAAEDEGDFAGALRLVDGLPAGMDATAWRSQLEVAAGLPAEALPWLACWLIHPALRWALERPAGQLLESYARLMLATLGVHAPARNMRLAEVAAADPVVADAGLFDGGLFSRYLSTALAPAVLARVGWVAEWSRWPASIWEVGLDGGSGDSGVTLYDSWADESLNCLPWPGAAEAYPGQLLYGRIVSTDGESAFAFALTPTSVDRRCAARVLRARKRGAGAEERLRAVAYSRRRQEIGGLSGAAPEAVSS